MSLGNIVCALTGGLENRGQAPHLMDGGRWSYHTGDAKIYESMLRDGLNDAFSNEHLGRHPEVLAEQSQITREEQDQR